MSKGKHGEAGASEGARRATGEASTSRPLVGTGGVGAVATPRVRRLFKPSHTTSGYISDFSQN